MTYLSPEEVEQQHLRAMGPALGPVYHALYNELLWLDAKWSEFRKLFAQSQRRIDLLNSTAGYFFWMLQRLLWEEVLLHIARLTDQPNQNGHENLSLLGLRRLVPEPVVGREVGRLAGAAKRASAFAREWRDKRIAHRDLSLALDRQAEPPLPNPTRQHVEEALASFRRP